MRPVNLLPEDLRPRQATGALSGSSYAVLGVLGVLFLMVVAYVLSSNQVNDRKSEIAQVEQETAEAEARLAKLSSYEEFARIKTTRFESVKQLASLRFDWERMMREVAIVLPADTWVTELTAGTADAALGGTAAAPAAPADPAATTAAAGPTMQLKGCAERQPDVATLMVRLRKLHRAADIELIESTEQSTTASSGGATPGQVGGGDAGGTSGCPTDTYQFDIKVLFTAIEEVQKRQVPARLGGGA